METLLRCPSEICLICFLTTSYYTAYSFAESLQVRSVSGPVIYLPTKRYFQTLWLVRSLVDRCIYYILVKKTCSFETIAYNVLFSVCNTKQAETVGNE